MKTITERLMELDPSLEIHDEGEWNNTKSRYMAFNSGGVECEVGEFLYSLVRMIKPQRILETGTHLGIGAFYMGLALKDNEEVTPEPQTIYGEPGHLDTVEFIEEIYAKAVHRIVTVGLESYVTCHLADARQFLPEMGNRYNLILLDTEPQTRFEEFIKFWDYLIEGGFVFIHDLNRHMHQLPVEDHEWGWPFGKVPEFMTSLVRRREALPWHFPTPRGITGFYKAAEVDFKWGIKGGGGKDAV